MREIVGDVLLDFSASCNVIDYELLLGKLMVYSFKVEALRSMESYLTNRSQLVYVNGSFSSTRRLDCGVPLGGCLGPLHFPGFTNDLQVVLKRSSIIMYTDNSTLYKSAHSLTLFKDTLQSEVECVSNWIENNKLILK